ncbi:multiple sugar transport system substrate-binding protein, partial [Candidatus Hakubella thermalkaliphila]
MRRYVGILVVLAMATALVLVSLACQAKPAAEEAPEAAEVAKEPVKITYWHFEPREKAGKDVLIQVIDQFNAQNPDIQVELVMIPKDDFNVKLLTAVAAGAGPDASIIDQPLVATYASQGALLSLESPMHRGAPRR